MKGRKLLMIPGPIEFEPAVMQIMSQPTTSHIAPDFIESFGNALEMMKNVWFAPSGQPFIIAGSGTFAMDLAGANLIEPGDNALVISTGYFGERFAELLKRYGANVTMLKAKLGDVVPFSKIEEELKNNNYKLMTITHVDTSTSVLNDAKSFGELGRKYGVLTILDGVCSVAGEEIRQEDWGIDVVLTASQKAIGVPPGLALLVASNRAIKTWKERKTPVANYYADWGNWLPIMRAYEERRPSYFGTPPVNLIQALEVSLSIILKEGIENRFNRHIKTGLAFRSALNSMGLKIIPVNDKIAANTLSAVYFPNEINGGEFLSQVSDKGVILAGGLLPEIKSKYFRIGHMGSVNLSDSLAAIGAIESALTNLGSNLVQGKGLKIIEEKLGNSY